MCPTSKDTLAWFGVFYAVNEKILKVEVVLRRDDAPVTLLLIQ